MPRRISRVVIVLLLLIFAGGMLLAVVSPSISQNGGYPSTQLVGSSGGFAPAYSGGALQGLTNSLGGLTSFATSAGVAGTTTVTMTSTTVAGYPSTEVIKSNPTTGLTSSSNGPSAEAGSNSSRSIEFFNNVTLQVASASSALDKITALSYSLGGYVAYSTFSSDSAIVVLRVPAQDYQDAVVQVESLGTVLTATSSSNDVTVQYTDLNATLRSLTTEQASLLKLLNSSTNINATLNIESRVQQVNQQIDEVQSQILQTRTLIAYSTITVSLQERAAPAPLAMKLTATPRSGMNPLSVTFNALVSGGSAPYVVNYNFGDGTSSQGQSLIHTFVQPGRFNVTVAATDSTGNVTEGWTIINVSAAPFTSSLGNFPGFVGDLFLRVVEGIIEVAVIVIPIALAIALVVFPFRRRLGPSARKQSNPQ
jgi:hypothetical protein